MLFITQSRDTLAALGYVVCFWFAKQGTHMLGSSLKHVYVILRIRPPKPDQSRLQENAKIHILQLALNWVPKQLTKKRILRDETS
jgi:hypothetical protein